MVRLDATRKSFRAKLLLSVLNRGIIGQSKAISSLVSVIEKFESGFYNKTRPIASLLFLGPTGVGKTESVETFVFGLTENRKGFIKIDCVEYQHSHEISKLIGSPPGYLGHRETKPFFTTERLQSFHTPTTPFCVILFDEIEKASDALWNILLGILDKGTLALGTNDIVDMSQTIIIFTSNVGSREIAEGNVGYVSNDPGQSETINRSMSAARKKFMPEFLNRLDDVVVFNTLTTENLKEILNLEIEKLQVRINESQACFHLNVSPAAQKQILIEGYSPKYNARYLRRTMEKYLELPLSRLVATNQVLSRETVVVDFQEGEWRYFGNIEETETSRLLSRSVEVSELSKSSWTSSAPLRVPFTPGKGRVV